MRHRSYRRAHDPDRPYGAVLSGIHAKPPFIVILAAAAAVFIMFAMLCFAAVTYEAARSDMAESREKGRVCTVYYQAESTAADILSIMSSDNGASLTDGNGELRYTAHPDGDIIISRNGGNISFDVPIDDSDGKKTSLHVIAQISGGDVKIIQWYVRT